MHIYTLTMIKWMPKEPFYDSMMINEYKGNRCIGFYRQCDTVMDVVLHDGFIWEEGWYEYACIERIKQGTHFIDFTPLWVNQEGEIIDTPERYRHVCCLGIG